MTKPSRRQVLVAGVALLVLAAVVFAFLPERVPVQTAVVERGPLQVVVEEEGRTRLSDRYVVSAPVAAFVRRIALEEGDRVEEGQALVELEPPRAAILDPRTRAQADSRVEAARASLARAEVEAAQARAELGRTERLHDVGAATPQALEAARSQAARAEAALESARAELDAAVAARRTSAGTPSFPVEEVLRAPVGGRVLAVHAESGGHVQPGAPLVEVGETERLQVVADVLSRDAVRIRPGTPVLVEEWGGEEPLEAVVRRVDPEGFTEVSALGVEEQRVRVVADLDGPAAAREGLGPGYGVLARFVVWEASEVLQVPTAALFREGDRWAAFVVEGGRARLRPVTPGREAGLLTQVEAGLEEGETVVVHPGNDVEDGVRVSPGRG